MVLTIAVGLYVEASGVDGEHARAEAARWMHTQGVEGRPECTASDTDGDGFVDCTIVLRRPGGSTELLPLECAGKLTFARGCRAVKAAMTRLHRRASSGHDRPPAAIALLDRLRRPARLRRG